MHPQADTKIGKELVDSSEPIVVDYLSGGSGMLSLSSSIFHGILECIVCPTSRTPRKFKKFLAHTRASGVPSKVVLVRSEGSSEFHEGNFGDMCTSRDTKQEFPTADGPHFHGLVERALRLIGTAAMTG